MSGKVCDTKSDCGFLQDCKKLSNDTGGQCETNRQARLVFLLFIVIIIVVIIVVFIGRGMNNKSEVLAK